MKKLSHFDLLKRQEIKKEKLPFTVILNNIRSLHNVGSIFRTSDGVGVEKLWLCGITGYPPNSQIAKTALDAEDHVSWEYCEDVRNVLRKLKSEGYTIVYLEQMNNSIPYQELSVNGPVCLVLGNEITGVSKDILSFCDQAVEIEMTGVKNSLNVSVAFGIVAYHIKHSLQSAIPV